MQRHTRIIIDILLIIVLPVVVCIMLTGLKAHEWLAVGLAVAAVVHLVLNRRWFKDLFCGRHTAPRILVSVVNILLLADIAALMVSGMYISHFAFAWTGLPEENVFEMHQVHLFAGYWGLLLTGLHLGQHVPALSGMLRVHRLGKGVRLAFLALFVVAGCYGVYAFIHEDIANCLVPGEHFTWTQTAPSLYLLEMLCLMTTCALLGYALQRVVRK